MTRGTAFLLLPKSVWSSIEFNGGMDPEEHGGKFSERLSNVDTIQDFLYMIKLFNSQTFNYTENEFIYKRKDITLYFNVIDFSRDYFDKFFSNWCFFKNMTGETVIFNCRDKQSDPSDPINQINLPNNKAATINFGYKAKHFIMSPRRIK